MTQGNDFVIAAMLEEGLIRRDQLESGTRYAAEHDLPLPEALVVLGVVSRRAMAVCRAQIFECPFVDLDAFQINVRNTQLLAQSAAERLMAFPLFDLGDVVTVGMADPLDLHAVDQLRRTLGAEVDPVLCDSEALAALIARTYALTAGRIDPEYPEADGHSRTAGAEPEAVRAIDHILARAAAEGAVSVHIGPDEHDLRLRYRIDGGLHERPAPAGSRHADLVKRLKVMASLDPAQTRRPQEGRFRFSHTGMPLDVRLSFMPTIHGENVVMRLTSPQSAVKSFRELGIASDTVDAVESAISRSHGLFLVTGPTGSGKSSTLYAALQRINTADRNVMTVEDPVEVRVPMARQLQVNPEIGLTFAGALRSVLRQDPDVVLIGEIRDAETARTACQAALTGHLLLSSLHTHNATDAIDRLRGMGCPSFAIGASLVGVLAQRLLRKVCECCARPDEPDVGLLRSLRLGRGDTAGLARGVGCGKCMSIGFRGRIAATELFGVNPAMQELIDSGAAAAKIRDAAIAAGMRPLWRDALEKAQMGLTTLQEVGRVLAIDGLESAPEAPDRINRAA
ncbi:MAG: GspE/PulE family protein [Phycisphaerales bacterium JB041]